MTSQQTTSTQLNVNHKDLTVAANVVSTELSGSMFLTSFAMIIGLVHLLFLGPVLRERIPTK